MRPRAWLHSAGRSVWGGIVGMARILGWIGVFGHEPVGPDGEKVEFVDLDDAKTFLGVSQDAEIAPIKAVKVTKDACERRVGLNRATATFITNASTRAGFAMRTTPWPSACRGAGGGALATGAGATSRRRTARSAARASRGDE